MKNVIILMTVIGLFACEQKFVPSDVVCQIGRLPGATSYTLIRCTDNDGWIAGDNIAAGGVDLSAYVPGSINLTYVVKCKTCREMYPN